MDYSLLGSSVHEIFLGKNTGRGCHFLLQGIFSTQGLNLCLLRWQVDSLPLSYLETPFRTAVADTEPSGGNGECRCGPKQDPLCQLRAGWGRKSRLEKSTSIPARSFKASAKRSNTSISVSSGFPVHDQLLQLTQTHVHHSKPTIKMHLDEKYRQQPLPYRYQNY